MNKFTAIYARQSIDRADSVSIETQVEKCVGKVEGGKHKVYTDRGYSGKNTNRPDFEQLIRDIESGLVSTVIVYKLDRISRSVLDFVNMMDFFKKCSLSY
jgi:DNA invertase Pin-like site-specific DNA recombinase